MSISELEGVVPSPRSCAAPSPGAWLTLQQTLNVALPSDFRDYSLSYGSGYFDDPRRLMVFVWNPFSPEYLLTLEQVCDELRAARLHLNREPNIPYGVFPHQPGWLPWGCDIDGSLMCWLTEGEPDDWPIILLTPEKTTFQQLHMSMTTFLARAFKRQIRTILWDDPAFFIGPDPVRFVPDRPVQIR